MALLSAAVVTMVLSLAVLTSAIPGTYYTNSDMEHRRLPNPLPDGVKTPIASEGECEAWCSRHSTCDAFAYSSFHKTCQIYQVKVGERAIIQNMYKLYVREKGTDEGYLKHGTDYLKLVLKMQNAKEAKATCAAEGGKLVSIKSQGLNDVIHEELGNRAVSAAFIGLSDEAEEMSWVFADGTPVGDYDNWDWKGVWTRKDLNCAIIGLDGTWSHTNCLFKFYSICQIPMF